MKMLMTTTMRSTAVSVCTTRRHGVRISRIEPKRFLSNGEQASSRFTGNTPLVRKEQAPVPSVIQKPERGGNAVVLSQLGRIVRHGSGDGVITLSVGGKEFQTLRSTVASNDVLCSLVRASELNQELSNGKAVFIDRNPEHFELILTFLRNRIEGIAHAQFRKSVAQGNQKFVQLPKDTTKLQDIYSEASYFGLEELKTQACTGSLVIYIAGLVTGGGNPFDFVSRAINSVRQAAIVLASGLTATAGLSGNLTDFINDLKAFLPIISFGRQTVSTNIESETA